MTLSRRTPRLTDDEAEKLADYVEQLRPEDLGAGRPGPGFRGRPSLTKGSATHSPSIHVRLPETLYLKLSNRADSTGSTVSEVVRKILSKHAPRS